MLHANQTYISDACIQPPWKLSKTVGRTNRFRVSSFQEAQVQISKPITNVFVMFSKNFISQIDEQIFNLIKLKVNYVTCNPNLYRL